MGPSVYEAKKRSEMQREIERLKESVDYHRILLASVQDRLTVLERPRVQEFTAADAYRKSIKIVEDMKDDCWTRNIPNDVAKQWVIATVEDIVRALEHRLNRCEGKI